MTKKQDDKAKKLPSSSIQAREITRALVTGNNFVARKCAKQLMVASDVSQADRELSEYVLRVTWPEPNALLTGLACLALSTIVAFVVGY